MKLLIVAVLLSITITGCQKDNDTAPDPTKLELLTGKQWFYTEIYYNATAPRTGTLIYKRGAVGNTENRDNSRALFWQDGTFDQMEPSGHIKMQWSFSNSEKTEYTMSWPGGSTNVKIIQLTENTFEWFNPQQQLSGLMFSKL